MSAENPAVPLSTLAEGDDVYDALTGSAPAAGIRVNRGRALGLSAVWRGVNLIAGDVGRHDFRVYKYVGDAGIVADSAHQAALVMRRPNEYMTPFTFRQVIQAHALLAGNGYAFIVRDPDAKPLELLPLDPERTYPVRADGVLWYVTQSDNPLPGKRRNARQWLKLWAADVLHIKGLGFDGLCGYPVLQILRDTLAEAIAARDYGSRYFSNDGRPGVVLEVPANMKESAINNLRKTWEELHVGVSNAHRPAILRDGVKLVPFVGGSARDAQLLENREFDTREIANVIGVPPHKLGDPSKTAYNSLESENQSYFEDTLDRWFVAWEQEADAKLLREDEKLGETHCCKFDPRKLSRVSLAVRGAYYSQAITGGWLSPDEVRAYETLNPIPGGFGKTYNRPVNIAPMNAPAPAADAGSAPATDTNPQQGGNG